MTSRVVLVLPSFTENVVVYSQGMASEVVTPEVAADMTINVVSAEVSTQITTLEEP